jgi:nucleoside-diphosphate-sugar epimerase
VLGNSSGNQPLGAGNVADDTYNGGVAGSRNVLGSVQRSSSVRRLVYTSSLAAMNNSSGHWKPWASLSLSAHIHRHVLNHSYHLHLLYR